MIAVFSKELAAVLHDFFLDLTDFLVSHFLEAGNVIQCDVYEIQIAFRHKILTDIVDLMLVRLPSEDRNEVLHKAGPTELFGMFLHDVVGIFFNAYLSEKVYELLLAYGFEKVIDHSQSQCSLCVFEIREAAQYDEIGIESAFLLHPADELEARQFGHPYVDDRKVDLLALYDVICLKTVGSRSCDLASVELPVDKHLESLEDKRLVICQKYLYPCHYSSPPSLC